MADFTLIVPYYRQPRMLHEQLRIWEAYPEGVRIILVDDGSPEPAARVIWEYASDWLRSRLSLYRIEVDIPWNRGGARNLGAKEATTEWIVHVDIDHVLTGDCARRLLAFEPNPKHWYRFERFRNGTADETRKKDKIPPQMAWGKIHPHMDSYLCRGDLYWKAGGYDEDYSGILGGGSPFLKNLEAAAKPAMLPAEIFLQVYTRSVVSDASDWALNRDRTPYAELKRRKERSGKTKGTNPIRFPWAKQDLCTRE